MSSNSGCITLVGGSDEAKQGTKTKEWEWYLDALEVNLVEGEQASKGLAALLQLVEGCICPLLLQGPLAGLVQGYNAVGVAAPLLKQLLEEGLVPHMQAAATQPYTHHCFITFDKKDTCGVASICCLILVFL